jgi:hypothetical protein
MAGGPQVNKPDKFKKWRLFSAEHVSHQISQNHCVKGTAVRRNCEMSRVKHVKQSNMLDRCVLQLDRLCSANTKFAHPRTKSAGVKT